MVICNVFQNGVEPITDAILRKFACNRQWRAIHGKIRIDSDIIININRSLVPSTRLGRIWSLAHLFMQNYQQQRYTIRFGSGLLGTMDVLLWPIEDAIFGCNDCPSLFGSVL